MTCVEKLKLDYPDDYDLHLAVSCPHDYGYAEDPDKCHIGSAYTCSECWDREVKQAEGTPVGDSVGLKVSNPTLVDEICETRNKLINAGFESTEAFNLICIMFESRLKNER